MAQSKASAPTYRPSRFMAQDSQYDKALADKAVYFFSNLRHTKGKWEGKRFELLPWQEQIIRDIFGIVKRDGKRQFKTAYIEVPKKCGKSELAAGIALKLAFADGEPHAEVYGCACDKKQAQIVYDVAADMVEMWPELKRRITPYSSAKKLLNKKTGSFYSNSTSI